MADIGPLLGPSPAPTEFLEAYRALRAAVLSMHVRGEASTIVVTSAIPSEGKTTVAANLATVLALAEKKTLLVDADFRRPQVAVLNEIGEAPGLTDVCAGKAELAAALRASKVPNLSLLPAGGLAEGGADMMGSVRMTQLVMEFKRRFDLVIVDTAPVNYFAGAVQLAAVVDLVLLVVRSRTHAGPVQRALRALDAVGANVPGVVLNDVLAIDRDTGGRYHYGYGYGYGPGRSEG